MPHIEKLAAELVKLHGKRAGQRVVDNIKEAICDGTIDEREVDLRRLQASVDTRMNQRRSE